MAAQISFRNHTPAGFLHCISRYPVGCGFMQHMRQPAVWCASAGAPCPHQLGGGLARRLRGTSAVLDATTPTPRGAGAREHAPSNVDSLQERAGLKVAHGCDPDSVARGAQLRGWADTTNDVADAVPSLMLAGPHEADVGWSSACAATRADGTAQAPSAREQMQAAQSECGASALKAQCHSAGMDPEDTSAVEAALVSLAGPAPLDHATWRDGLQYGSTADWTPAVHAAVAETHASEDAAACANSDSGSERGAIGTTAARSWAPVEIDMFSWAHASLAALRCVPRSGRRGSAVDADVAAAMGLPAAAVLEPCTRCVAQCDCCKRCGGSGHICTRCLLQCNRLVVDNHRGSESEDEAA